MIHRDRNTFNGNRRASYTRTALFVDFDNIYIGLNNLDSQAAESFVSNPADWLRWIENGMPAALDCCQEAPGGRRSVLIRNCYLNPRTFYRFRPYFTRAAFTVVDCPPLTEKGKTSSDIRMVMDVLDTLRHETRFDEFILLSGDADFTPVLQRLRAHDRRTTVLAVGPASEAYKSACDYLISVDNFIEFALGVSGVESVFPSTEEPRQNGSEVNGRLIERMGEQLSARAGAEGEVLAANLAQIYREFDLFRNSSDWLGYGSLRRLTQAVVETRTDLVLIDSDPWKVVLAMPGIATGVDGCGPFDALESTARRRDQESLRQRVTAFVRERLDAVDQPMLMAKIAQEVIKAFGEDVLATQWAGAGSFRALIEGSEGGYISIFTEPGMPAYIYDAKRHVPPKGDAGHSQFADLPADLAGFIQRIHNLTHVPDLTPQEYAEVFQSLEAILRAHRYHFTGTSKMVRDHCIEQGHSVSRAAISFILRGISYGGHRFGQRAEKDLASTFAEVFRRNVKNLCADAELTLNAEDLRLLNLWITADAEAAASTSEVSDDDEALRQTS